jgi:hypothetical protein
MKLRIEDSVIAAGLIFASGAAVATSIGWQALIGFVGGVVAALVGGAIISNAE